MSTTIQADLKRLIIFHDQVKSTEESLKAYKELRQEVLDAVALKMVAPHKIGDVITWDKTSFRKTKTHRRILVKLLAKMEGDKLVIAFGTKRVKNDGTPYDERPNYDSWSNPPEWKPINLHISDFDKYVIDEL